MQLYMLFVSVSVVCALDCHTILVWDYTITIINISDLYYYKSAKNQPVQKWLRLNQLDNRSYSTIHPPTYPTYIMMIGVWPTLLEFFDFLSQKLIRTTQQNSHQNF